MKFLGQIFIRILNIFLFGNWLISIAGVLLTISSIVSFELEISFQTPVLVFVAAGTMLVYSVHAIYQNHPSFLSVRTKWISNNHKILVINIIIAIVLIAVVLPFLNKKLLLLMVPCGLISLAYSFPIIRINKKLLALREIPFIKVLVVSAVWSLVSVLLPLLHINADIWQEYGYKAGMLIGIRFLVLLILCLLFDIRDVKTDRMKGIKTFLSSIAGIKQLKVACFTLLILLSLLSQIVSETDSLYLIIFDAAVTAFIISASEDQSDYYYSFAGDGLIVLYSVAVLFSN